MSSREKVVESVTGARMGLAPMFMRTWQGEASPDDDCDRPGERGDYKTEEDPRPVSLCSPGRHKKMDRDPQTHRESQSEPNQIAEGLVDGRETFALRTAHAYRHGHERTNEQRSKSK